MHNLTEKVISGSIDDNVIVNNNIDYVKDIETNLKEDDDAINLSNIIRLAFHYRWLILIISFVTTLIAYSITAFVTPIYESQGTIIISTPSNKFSMAGNDISSLLMSSYGIGLGTSISNELEILNSRSLGYSLSQKIYEERFDQNGRLYPLL
jgi:uncharacterized protein involved in exopolysaccharide biosynthesis